LAPSADEGRGTLREASTSRVQTLSVEDVRMGKPDRGHARSPARVGTRGTETSQYPEERKRFRQ